jgi:CRP-like cAMP-binding protein/nucleotide-binding universal stress UspA family protein
MYRKVLVPLDKSKEAEKVLPIVKDLFAPGSEVVLLHVIPPQQTQALGERQILGSEREEAERSVAMSYLQFVVHQQGEDPERWRGAVLVSESVAEGIVGFAVHEGVDLIAMYTHDRKGLAKLIKGSITEKVQRRAPIEVKVFRPRELAEPVPAPVPAEDNLSLKRRILKETDVFRGLSETQMGRVAVLANQLQVKAGEVLEQADELGDRLFVIITGDAQLYAHTAVGEVTVRIAGPGESFPLAALVGAGTPITSGKALTDMELLAILRSALLELCSKDLTIAARLYSAIAEVFADRYRKTLAHLSINAERVLRGADFLEKVEEPRVLG